MLFFQITLVLGYLYSYLTTRYLGLKRQVALHLLLLLVAYFLIDLNPQLKLERSEYPIYDLLLFAFRSIGAPFFVLSASAPLLQAWFSKSSQNIKSSPYFLYSASNLGSLLALVLYPLYVERNYGVIIQSQCWRNLYFGLGILFSACTLFLLNSDVGASRPFVENQQRQSWYLRLSWVMIAFIPSSLMLGLTSFVTTDIAPVSLFWVFPLSLYLLSFIISFSGRIKIGNKVIEILLVIGIFIFSFSTFWSIEYRFIYILINLLLFFLISLYFHSRLAELKPEPSYLAEFFVLLSVGGMFGGVFNSIIAPIIFKITCEYWVILILSIWMTVFLSKHEEMLGSRFVKLFSIRFIALIVLFLLLQFYNGSYLFLGRSFYGTIKILKTKIDNQVLHTLNHGTTTHGMEIVEPEGLSKQLLSYYHEDGAFGDIRRRFISPSSSALRIGIIGLGIGTLACMKKEEDQVDFFEIDSLIEDVASDTTYFRYLEKCPSSVYIGDGRLLLESRPFYSYNILIIDAFSGDSVPTHLLTQEAVEIYLSRIKLDGIIAFHISNRYLDLSRVVANYDLPSGYVALLSQFSNNNTNYYYPQSVALIAPRGVIVDEMLKSGHWTQLAKEDEFKKWTDDFTSLIEIVNF
jgi:hypothetical protein